MELPVPLKIKEFVDLVGLLPQVMQKIMKIEVKIQL